MKNNIEKNTNTFNGFANRVWARCESICIELISNVAKKGKELIEFKCDELFENLKNK